METTFSVSQCCMFGEIIGDNQTRLVILGEYTVSLKHEEPRLFVPTVFFATEQFILLVQLFKKFW